MPLTKPNKLSPLKVCIPIIYIGLSPAVFLSPFYTRKGEYSMEVHFGLWDRSRMVRRKSPTSLCRRYARLTMMSMILRSETNWWTRAFDRAWLKTNAKFPKMSANKLFNPDKTSKTTWTTWTSTGFKTVCVNSTTVSAWWATSKRTPSTNPKASRTLWR